MSMRLVGVELNEKAPVRYALQRIYGIGDSTAVDLLAKLGIDPRSSLQSLAPRLQQDLAGALGEMAVEGELRQQQRQNIIRLISIKSYRGTRHVKRFPARGQRTKSNAKTCKRVRG